MQPLKNAILFLFAFIFFCGAQAQTPVKTYTAEWKKINDLLTKQNLPVHPAFPF